MAGLPVALVGTLGMAFLAASMVPAGWGDSQSAAASQPTMAPVATKADRLALGPMPSERATVTIVELIGVSEATVILRSRDGTVLYRSDPLSNTTTVAKDADLPVITLKEAPSPVVRPPTRPHQESEQPRGGKRRATPIGCEAVVSSLVGEDIRQPGLCLAALSGDERS
jgi:hypothetical protein